MFITEDAGESRPAPKPPHFRLRDVDRLRSRLLRSPLLSRFIGPAPNQEEMDLFEEVWLSLLPKGVQPEALSESLLPLAGSSISEEVLKELCWRFAGNVVELRAGRPVMLWRTQRRDEWVPLDIVEVTPRRSARGQAGADFACRILSGSPAGLISQAFFTTTFCHWISPKLGFTYASKDFPFRSVHQWARLRLLGLLRVERSLTQPRFVEVAVPSVFQAYNRALIKKRARKGFVCPKGYKHVCHVCPIGYSECRAAVRPRTLVKRPCHSCDKISYFDPGLVGVDSCLACYYKYRLRRSK